MRASLMALMVTFTLTASFLYVSKFVQIQTKSNAYSVAQRIFGQTLASVLTYNR